MSQERGPAPATSQEREATPAAEATPAEPEAAAAGVDLAALWDEKVVPGLKGITKALFKMGRVVETDAGSLTLGLENSAGLGRCEEKRPEAEAALTAAAGRPVRITLVVAGEAASGPRPDRGPGPAATPADEESIDPAELVDAPAQQISGVDRVTEAFPGAQVVDP